MSEGRQYHPIDNSRDSKVAMSIGPVTFEGNTIMWFGGALLASLLIFKSLSSSGYPALYIIVATALPLVAVTVYVTFLKRGKAPSFDLEFWESFWLTLREIVGLGVSFMRPKQAPRLAENPFANTDNATH